MSSNLIKKYTQMVTPPKGHYHGGHTQRMRSPSYEKYQKTIPNSGYQNNHHKNSLFGSTSKEHNSIITME